MKLHLFLSRRVMPAVALAVCLSSVHAAEKARAAAPPAKSGDRILSPAQLRECVTKKEQLRGQTEAALKVKGEIAADRDEIERSGTAIAEALASLDRTSAEAVAAHNAKVNERSALADAYQAKVDAYNGRAESIQGAHDGYEKACGNRRYDDRDLIDLQRKK